MNVRHQDVLHSFSIKNIFYDKMDLRLFYFDMTKLSSLHLLQNACGDDQVLFRN